ncbi:hypothetical protein [Nostocoides australiense]|uniref:hypothetical protein n=1 Tax=Nostocoides australiense TaxID=99480 RepID=UPI0012EED4DB|nr:hypothetical protein [Tetrasphaera australiensis]
MTGRYRAHPWLGAIAPAGVPLRPSVYAWTEALLLALAGAPTGIDEMRLAMLLDAVVRGYAAVGQSDSPPPAWLGPALAERFPRLAGELGRDFSDLDAELDTRSRSSCGESHPETRVK